jgi:hypothetical protein
MSRHAAGTAWIYQRAARAIAFTTKGNNKQRFALLALSLCLMTRVSSLAARDGTLIGLAIGSNHCRSAG